MMLCVLLEMISFGGDGVDILHGDEGQTPSMGMRRMVRLRWY
jgi:hypothetical protein